jgi:dephospho-CoA kinase
VSLAQSTVAIGMTGAFGSGCTTAGLALQKHQGFHVVRLSEFVREELARSKPEVKNPSRQQLQAMGGRIRERDGLGALVIRALNELDAAGEVYLRVVFDGLRNPGEVQALRERFESRFALLGVLSDGTTRWDRVIDTYLREGTEQAGFLEDDERDRGEAAGYGQQVARCVDQADVILVNSAATTLPRYEEKVLDICDLLMRKKFREPTTDEIRMVVAKLPPPDGSWLRPPEVVP